MPNVAASANFNANITFTDPAVGDFMTAANSLLTNAQLFFPAQPTSFNVGSAALQFNNAYIQTLTVIGGIPTVLPLNLTLARPAAPTVTPTGTAGTTTYYYQIIAHTLPGGLTNGYTGTPPGANVGSTATGNATLTGGNYNAISWTAVPGATGYDVVKWNGSAWTWISLNQAGTTFNDTGVAMGAYTVPTTNTTGSIGALLNPDEATPAIFTDILVLAVRNPGANTVTLGGGTNPITSIWGSGTKNLLPMGANPVAPIYLESAPVLNGYAITPGSAFNLQVAVSVTQTVDIFILGH